MVEICPKCGLPKDICTCDVRDLEAQKVRVFVEKRRWNKMTTIIEGVEENGKELASHLKSKLACGGTFKGGKIELQGDHRARLGELLKKAGYDEEQIDIS